MTEDIGDTEDCVLIGSTSEDDEGSITYFIARGTYIECIEYADTINFDDQNYISVYIQPTVEFAHTATLLH
jgi:hypothetical protein